MVLFEAQLPTFPSVILSLSSGAIRQSNKLQLSLKVWHASSAACRLSDPAILDSFGYETLRGANRVGVRSLPEIQDSDDYEAVVQAADSQQATNHSLSSRSQKRLRAYHLLKLPWANIVT